MEKCSATSQTTVYKGLENGRTKAGRGKDCHWLTGGQLPVDDGQGSWPRISGHHRMGLIS